MKKSTLIQIFTMALLMVVGCGDNDPTGLDDGGTDADGDVDSDADTDADTDTDTDTDTDADPSTRVDCRVRQVPVVGPWLKGTCTTKDDCEFDYTANAQLAATEKCGQGRGCCVDPIQKRVEEGGKCNAGGGTLGVGGMTGICSTTCADGSVANPNNSTANCVIGLNCCVLETACEAQSGGGFVTYTCESTKCANGIQTGCPNGEWCCSEVGGGGDKGLGEACTVTGLGGNQPGVCINEADCKSNVPATWLRGDCNADLKLVCDTGTNCNTGPDPDAGPTEDGGPDKDAGPKPINDAGSDGGGDAG